MRNQLQARFDAQPALIKSRIESLINLEYLERDPDNVLFVFKCQFWIGFVLSLSGQHTFTSSDPVEVCGKRVLFSSCTYTVVVGRNFGIFQFI